MSDIKKIMELIDKNGGYITTKEVITNNINKMALKRLADADAIIRVRNGYYILPNMFIDEYYNIVSRSKNAVFSYETGLLLHGINIKQLTQFDLTVQSGYSGALQHLNNVKLHYVKPDIFNIGMEVIKSPYGMNIKCYDIERCICDIIKHNKKNDILEYISINKIKISKLKKYAKALKLNVDEIIKEMNKNE